MFGHQKHVFTCPDVIYLRAKARRNARISLVLNVALMATIAFAGKIASDRIEKDADRLSAELDDLQTPHPA